MSCHGHLLEYYATFNIDRTNADFRQWTACSCFCPKCNCYHNCFKPEYFTEKDFETTSIPWCCINFKITDKDGNVIKEYNE